MHAGSEGVCAECDVCGAAHGRDGAGSIHQLQPEIPRGDWGPDTRCALNCTCICCARVYVVAVDMLSMWSLCTCIRHAPVVWSCLAGICHFQTCMYVYMYTCTHVSICILIFVSLVWKKKCGCVCVCVCICLLRSHEHNKWMNSIQRRARIHTYIHTYIHKNMQIQRVSGDPEGQYMKLIEFAFWLDEEANSAFDPVRRVSVCGILGVCLGFFPWSNQVSWSQSTRLPILTHPSSNSHAPVLFRRTPNRISLRCWRDDRCRGAQIRGAGGSMDDYMSRPLSHYYINASADV